MKYNVTYSIDGSIELEGDSKEQIIELLKDIEADCLLEKSLTWFLRINPEDIGENLKGE